MHDSCFVQILHCGQQLEKDLDSVLFLQMEDIGVVKQRNKCEGHILHHQEYVIVWPLVSLNYIVEVRYVRATHLSELPHYRYLSN